jgi:D-glycero-alpha-D-manno-heptose-7-phosphate kinase
MAITTGLEIHHDGDLPARSGLGSSSAFTVGLLSAMHALAGRYTSKEALANEAIHVEHDLLKEPVGLQDQISAAYGGFNHIVFRTDGSYEIRPMIVARERIAALQDHLLLIFTGISRLAAEVAQTVITNLAQKAADLHAMQQMVSEAIAVLSSPTRDLDDFGRLLGECWQRKRQLSSRVSNATIDNLYDTALRAGAVGGKLLGAGGGGFVLLFVRPPDRERVRAALKSLVTVPFTFDTSGCRIVLYQPDGL